MIINRAKPYLTISHRIHRSPEPKSWLGQIKLQLQLCEDELIKPLLRRLFDKFS